MRVPGLLQRHLSSFVFIAGLSSAAAFALAIDGWAARFLLARAAAIPADSSGPALATQAPLSSEDRRAAQVAWTYFEANTQHTGFVNSVDGFPSSTIWDQGSYFLALVSALRLEVIDSETFDARVTRALGALGRMPLYAGLLPNKAYDTRTLEMVDYDNSPTSDGVGWSALDLGRMLSGLRALEMAAPHHGPEIRAVVSGWSLGNLVNEGYLFGAEHANEGLEPAQEGRIGYEQYAARAAALWGLDAVSAASARTITRFREIEGVDVPTDIRTALGFGAITPVLSEPWMLAGLEIGLTGESLTLARRVFRAQEARFRRTGQVTMVSEDHLDRAPYFLYSSVFSNGQDWAVVTENGDHHPEFRTISTKAAFAWEAIFASPYAARARQDIAGLADPKKGWAAGIYEADQTVNEVYTLNTNAVILQALHYKVFGPLLKVR